MFASNHMWSSYFIVLMAASIYASPPTRKIELPLLEEQSVGSEIHDLMQDSSSLGMNGISFKLLHQYLTLGKDAVDEGTDWVTLDEETGVISVATPVDREEYCNADRSKPCVVHVKIVRQPQSALQWFDIDLRVIDINDHAPEFPIFPEISLNISEDAPVTTRISLDSFLATDQDQGSNAKIYYSLSRSPCFNVHMYADETTGDPHLQLVITDVLDYEDTKTYELTLTATDRGSPQQQSSSVKLRVNVEDANDHPPVFDEQRYDVQLLENVVPGTTITTVHASDADDNMFGELRYFVPKTGNSQTALNLIQVNPLSGEVSIKEPLDRERHDNLRVVMAARDLAPDGLTRTGKTIVSIHVTDINDNSPTIQTNIIVHTNGTAAFVSESSRIGTYIARVIIDDSDYGKNGEVTPYISTQAVRYSVSEENRNVEKFFVLEDGSYIKTNANLDRESISEYLLQIHACDGGTPSLCSSRNLTVILLDENDNSPTFLSPAKSIVLHEDTDIGTIVSSVHASDRDSILPPAVQVTQDKNLRESRSGDIIYSLHGSGGCFDIDEKSGKIRLVRPLDYETKKSWKMTATAWDMGQPRKSANTTISVDVIDVNDNTPVFTSPSKQNHTVAATIRSDDVIIQIIALDYDGASYSKLKYFITSEDGNKETPHLFILDKISGNLRLNISNPNLKAVVGAHTLQIKAQDSGSPPLSRILSLHVQVYDLPLAVLPSFTEKMGVEGEGLINLTVVLIASLASAALLLVIILSVMLLRCRRGKKETRSYSCRNFAAKSENLHLGSNLSNNLPAVTSDCIMTSSNSSFNSVNWKKSADTRFGSVASEMRSFSQTDASSRRSCAKESRFGVLVPAAAQVDKDSGRGDSDHDGASCDERETSRIDSMDSSSQNKHGFDHRFVGYGPLCSYMCEKYGHSDTCWMPPKENSKNREQCGHCVTIEGDHQTLMNDDLTNGSVRYQVDPYQYISYAMEGCDGRGLETISETQPLHSVLTTDQPYYDQQPAEYGYEEESRVVLLPSSDAEYHPSPAPQHRHLGHNHPAITPMGNEPGPTNLHSSVSDVFHDAASQPSSTTPIIASPQTRYHPSTSRSPRNAVANTDSSRRTSTSHRLQSIDENLTPLALSRYGEVSMKETQEIIENIDRLIDH